MRKRIEALLPGKSDRAASGLPCGGDMSAASPAYPPAPAGKRKPYAAANRIGEYPRGRCGKLRNGCPYSATCSFRLPSALRKRRRPANR